MRKKATEMTSSGRPSGRPRTAKHGTRSCYVAGCRKPECVAANTQYNRDKRAEKRGLASVSSLPDRPIPPEEGPQFGKVEAAVLAELETLSSVAKHPALAASVVVLAHNLDNQLLATSHPSMQRRLQAGLAELHEKSTGRIGKLTSISSMSKRSNTG